MSKIQCLRTIRIAERPNLIWVEIETDEGLVGLGESFRGAQAVEAVLHETIAPWLIGRDSRRIEAISRHLMTPYLGFASASAEVRAASAVDLALWDLAGKRHGIPVHEALGGASRTEIRTYNTCAGYAYNSGTAKGVAAGRRDIGAGDVAAGPYDDQIAFMRDAGALAESLLSEGYTAMKIWPLDIQAAASGGQMITLSESEGRAGAVPEDPRRGRRPDRGDGRAAQPVVLPGRDPHLPGAGGSRHLLGEDPIAKMGDFKALADLRRQTRVPICGSETLGGAVAYRQMLEAEAVDFVMLDLAWCGGLTEGRKIAALAEAFAKPLAPHDCTGPVTLMAGLQLAIHAPTAIFQEVVRATLATWYRDLVTDLPIIKGGLAQAPTAPGLGTNLLPEVRRREDATVREYGTPLRPGG